MGFRVREIPHRIRKRASHDLFPCNSLSLATNPCTPSNNLASRLWRWPPNKKGKVYNEKSSKRIWGPGASYVVITTTVNIYASVGVRRVKIHSQLCFLLLFSRRSITPAAMVPLLTRIFLKIWTPKRTSAECNLLSWTGANNLGNPPPQPYTPQTPTA